jgi:hypothetical protein
VSWFDGLPNPAIAGVCVSVKKGEVRQAVGA